MDPAGRWTQASLYAALVSQPLDDQLHSFSANALESQRDNYGMLGDPILKPHMDHT